MRMGRKGEYEKWGVCIWIPNLKRLARYNIRSSRPEVFCKKGVLTDFAKFTGKHLCQRLFFNKVAGLLKKSLSHRCFPVNFAKFLRTPFFSRTPPVGASAIIWHVKKLNGIFLCIGFKCIDAATKRNILWDTSLEESLYLPSRNLPAQS